jgi:hypothetical protein
MEALAFSDIYEIANVGYIYIIAACCQHIWLTLKIKRLQYSLPYGIITRVN